MLRSELLCLRQVFLSRKANILNMLHLIKVCNFILRKHKSCFVLYEFKEPMLGFMIHLPGF